MQPSNWQITMILCVLSVLLSGCLFTPSDYPKFLRSRYEYTLHIQANAPLHNATFYLPLPVKNGTPMVGPQILSPGDFAQDGYSVAFTQASPGLNLTSTNIEEYQVPGNTPWFVRIHADLWPNDSYRLEINSGPYDHPSPYLFANTLLPVGNESIFLPKLDFSPPQPIMKPRSNSFPDWIEYTNISSVQKTWIYADYSTDPETSVTVYLFVQGSNYWLDDYDRWIENNYQDYFNEELRGETHGGRIIHGEFIGGNHMYPDLSSPKWQRFIQNNPSTALQK